MNKEKIQLIESILNDLSIDMINTLYEIVVNNDYDFCKRLTIDQFKKEISNLENEINKQLGDKNE